MPFLVGEDSAVGEANSACLPADCCLEGSVRSSVGVSSEISVTLAKDCVEPGAAVGIQSFAFVVFPEYPERCCRMKGDCIETTRGIGVRPKV